MIHNTLETIYHRITNISEERKLALKISTVSFLVLIWILSAIIATSYYAQREKMYRDFSNEIQVFEWGKIGKGIREFFKENNNPPPFGIDIENDGNKELRWPRDVIIFDNNRNIIKNDYLDLDEEEVDKIFSNENGRNNPVEIDEHYYILHKKVFWEYTFFLTRDLTQLIEFHRWLIILAITGGFIGFIFIYRFSLHLARMVISPIREHNTSLSSYSHNVAHELKTPLAVMRSNMELLKLSQSEKLIDSTNEEIISMERIIDTLLLIANPKKNFSTSEKIDINQFTKNILENYPSKDIQFIPEKKKILIEWNAELYKRIIMNLIENALKYKSHGNITISLKGKGIRIENPVEKELDEGILKKLTEAFYQADTSRHSSGQWLGLALVKKIVDISWWKMRLSCTNNTFVAEIDFV